MTDLVQCPRCARFGVKDLCALCDGTGKVAPELEVAYFCFFNGKQPLPGNRLSDIKQIREDLGK